jgi:O-antigen/teichoic acid export membrane protein
MSRLRQLGKDSLIYGFGGIIAKSLLFLLFPIYTRIFTPVDYGSIEMLTLFSNFISTIFSMGMHSAQSMYFYKVKEEGQAAQARIVSAILQWRLFWGSGIVLIATITAPFFNAWFFGGQLNWKYFAIAFVGALFAQIMSQSAEVMRLLYRPWAYIGITLTQTIVSAGLTLTFVLLFNLGIFGFFLGGCVASFTVAFWGWFKIRAYWRFDRIHWDLWPQLLRFGAPLVPSSLAIYFMNTADRWFVQYYHGNEALGIFAVGAKFTMLATLAVTVFRQAWWPIAMDSMHSTDGPKTFRMIARMYMGLACAGIIVLTLLSPWLVKWFTGPAFHDAWPVVGILAWQAVFYGFFLIAGAGIWKSEKNILNFPLMFGAAVLGLGLNWLFVPLYGSLGAALATAITYFVWAVASLMVSERLWLVHYEVNLMLLQIALANLFVFWFTKVNQGELGLPVLLTGAGMASVLIASAVGPEERRAIRNYLYNLLP